MFTLWSASILLRALSLCLLGPLAQSANVTQVTVQCITIVKLDLMQIDSRDTCMKQAMCIVQMQDLHQPIHARSHTSVATLVLRVTTTLTVPERVHSALLYSSPAGARQL